MLNSITLPVHASFNPFPLPSSPTNSGNPFQRLLFPNHASVHWWYPWFVLSAPCRESESVFVCFFVFIRKEITRVGLPTLLRSPKYHRNQLLFNLCFVLSTGTPSAPYEPLLRKVADTLRALELEGDLVSRGDLSSSSSWLERLLRELHTQIKSKQECVVSIDAANTLFLKLQSPLPQAALWPEYRVPVPIVPLNQLSHQSWDLCVLRVARQIDGRRCILDLAQSAGMDVSTAQAAVRTLAVYGCVADAPLQLPLFNRYCATGLACKLRPRTRLGRACCKALQVIPSHLPLVARLYASMTPRCSLEKHLQDAHFPLHRPPFDVHRFISFGLVNRLIRVVSATIYERGALEEGRPLDELMARAGGPMTEAFAAATLARFQGDPKYVVLWK